MKKHSDFNKLDRGPPEENTHKIRSKSVLRFERSKKFVL